MTVMGRVRTIAAAWHCDPSREKIAHPVGFGQEREFRHLRHSDPGIESRGVIRAVAHRNLARAQSMKGLFSHDRLDLLQPRRNLASEQLDATD